MKNYQQSVVQPRIKRMGGTRQKKKQAFGST
jgi:hypothetical protein